MAEHPDRDEAAFAAKLDVDAYRIEGDMLGLRRAAAEYAGKAYGASGVKSEDFKNVLERVDFTIAENLGKEKKYSEAAAAYLSFFETYPKSPFRTLALSNAANNYERGGNITEANRLIERFVAAYPDDPASRAYYMRLGNNYGQVLDEMAGRAWARRAFFAKRGGLGPARRRGARQGGRAWAGASGCRR
jgi:tetratricopeptide (TPR) repeat protein